MGAAGRGEVAGGRMKGWQGHVAAGRNGSRGGVASSQCAGSTPLHACAQHAFPTQAAPGDALDEELGVAVEFEEEEDDDGDEADEVGRQGGCVCVWGGGAGGRAALRGLRQEQNGALRVQAAAGERVRCWHVAMIASPLLKTIECPHMKG